MGKSLDELASYFRPLAEKLITACEDAGIPVTVVDTGRTPVEQQQKLAQGVSWTEHSKHLPQPPEGKSEAIDLCPTEYLTMKNWNPTGPLWDHMGAIGESLGLIWGGGWLNHRDVGHFQYQHTVPNPAVNLDASDD
jgi:peptidoglycan LD-endopeptidase CwlK